MTRSPTLELLKDGEWCHEGLGRAALVAQSYFRPVDHVPEGGKVVCAAVLIFQIIGVFPDINSE